METPLAAGQCFRVQISTVVEDGEAAADDSPAPQWCLAWSRIPLGEADVTDSSTCKEARRARQQEEGRARTIALPEELCRQNERFHGGDDAWRIQLDKVVSRLVYKDGLAGSGAEATQCHPGN